MNKYIRIASQPNRLALMIYRRKDEEMGTEMVKISSRSVENSSTSQTNQTILPNIEVKRERKGEGKRGLGKGKARYKRRCSFFKLGTFGWLVDRLVWFG